MSASAFKGTYSDWKLVRTRQVVQIVFEIPLADADSAYEVLGGMPDASKERWFGIAALVAGAGTPTAGPLMANGNEKGSRNPGGSHALAPNASQTERMEAGRDEPAPGRPRKDWRDLGPAKQAGIRCDEPTFAAFLKEQKPDDWHEAQNDPAACVRLICGVDSRADLATNHKARVLWHSLDEKFQAWKALERA